MVGPEIGYIIGAGGLGLAVLREWIAAGERRRSRPVVVVHERQRRHLRPGKDQAVSVYLTNESAASAFNIRFGVNLGGTDFPWKHDTADAEPSRVNVLAPSAQYPTGPDFIDVAIPDVALFSIPGDPDEGRTYWAYYQSPAGDWWYTRNPVLRSDDLTVTRIRGKRLGSLSRRNRALARRIREGEEIQRQAIRELREGMDAGRQPPTDAPEA